MPRLWFLAGRIKSCLCPGNLSALITTARRSRNKRQRHRRVSEVNDPVSRKLSSKSRDGVRFRAETASPPLAVVRPIAKLRLGTMTKFHYWFPIDRAENGRTPAISGGNMTRAFCALPSVVLVGMLLGTPAPAQTPPTESPIAAGFWSFPTKKMVTAADIVAACRSHLEIRFADGHFIGLRLQRRDVGLIQREVEKVGRCTFNREKQIDGCDLKLIHADGSILAGTAEIKYWFDNQKVWKMKVTPKMITDSPVDNAPFEAFPVRCPDDAVWNFLNEASLPK
jgi:hypothetical protein